jgi:GxxExxY protein
MTVLLHKQDAYEIVGACLEVYNSMGIGFLEAVYQECLARELTSRGIPFAEQVQLPISYKGEPLQQLYKADFVCHGKIIVEIKALEALSGVHQAQVINYLHATKMGLGLLVNFGAPQGLEWQRLINPRLY